MEKKPRNERFFVKKNTNNRIRLACNRPQKQSLIQKASASCMQQPKRASGLYPLGVADAVVVVELSKPPVSACFPPPQPHTKDPIVSARPLNILLLICPLLSGSLCSYLFLDLDSVTITLEKWVSII
jgi:hypothetical protein